VTKAVAGSAISAAAARIVASGGSSSTSTTAAGLPEYGPSTKAFTRQ
jgi:hypothetical protein